MFRVLMLVEILAVIFLMKLLSLGPTASTR